MLTPVFESIGRRVAARPKTTVLVWLLLAVMGFTLALVGFGGGSLFDRLSSGEPAIPGSDSQRANEAIVAESDEGPSIRLLVTGVDPTDPAVAEVMTGVNADLALIDGVAPEGGVIDAFALDGGVEAPAAKNLLAADGNGFFVEVNLEAGLSADDEAQASADVEERLGTVDDDLRSVAPDATGIVGSNELVVDEITDQVEQDLKTGEAYALPFALVIMVFVFGGFLAAAMPLVGSLASIGAGLGVLYGLSYWLEVDASVVNVVSLLGLGLSIDYGLLIVSRFREELHKILAAGEEVSMRRRRGDGVVQAALARTMSTAGRTVAYSALIVAISIAGLMVFTPDILRAIGAAGLAVILIAVATALTLVPALLVLSGRRLARPGVLGRVPGLRAVVRRTADVVSDEGVFSRLTARVQRHPWWVATGSVVVLVVLALPVLGLQMRNSGIELLPVDATQRVFVDELADQYPAGETADLFVVTDGSLEATDAWAKDVASLDGVAAVGPSSAAGPYAAFEVYLTTDDAGGPEAVDAVHEIRALDAPFDAWVGGQAAGQVDFVDALSDRMWWAFGIVAAATLVLLFLMTGSVLIPVKALLTNVLSIAASLGVLTFVFQGGHGEGLLGFTSTGGIETYVVALVVAFAFGLAMDYEVFLLSRVKELFDAGHTNDEALRLGLQRSGRIITSAALIIVVVFLGFVFGDLLVIKEVGFALAVAVALDATIVRMLLVPATMTILGRANWWAPRPLRWVHRRLAITH